MNTSSEFVVVAGGAGFLGSHLCERLVGAAANVLCVDNLATGFRANIAHLEDNPAFRFLEADIVEPIEVPGRVTRIYNLACPASPPRYQADPIHTLKTSVIGTLNLLELARAKGARFLQASTSEVYGDAQVHPQPESYVGHVNPIGIRACYDEGKRAAETLIYDYQRQYGLSVRVARIFNTYGPRMDSLDGRVVSNMVVQALAGDDLTVYGDGSQTRSFCYRDDLIEGLLRLMDAGEEASSPTNIGNPGEFTISEFASLVLELTGSPSRISYLPLPQDDPRQRRPDIERARRLLGWEPRIALREGLERTIEYFASQSGSPAFREVLKAS